MATNRDYIYYLNLMSNRVVNNTLIEIKERTTSLRKSLNYLPNYYEIDILDIKKLANILGHKALEKLECPLEIRNDHKSRVIYHNKVDVLGYAILKNIFFNVSYRKKLNYNSFFPNYKLSFSYNYCVINIGDMNCSLDFSLTGEDLSSSLNLASDRIINFDILMLTLGNIFREYVRTINFVYNCEEREKEKRFILQSNNIPIIPCYVEDIPELRHLTVDNRYTPLINPYIVNTSMKDYHQILKPIANIFSMYNVCIIINENFINIAKEILHDIIVVRPTIIVISNNIPIENLNYNENDKLKES